jgi:hypothetical protein
MLLWEDGFDHYGSASHMVDGPYAQADCAISSAQVATGSSSLLINNADSSSDFVGLRFVLPTSKDKIGVAARWYFPSLPSDNTSNVIFDFLTSDPHRSQIRCIADSNGALRFYRGGQTSFSTISPGTLVTQTDPILTSGAWNHTEVQLYVHATAGWVRVAVNGVHRYQATNLNTLFNSDNIVSIGQHNPFTAAFNHYMDDYYIYDFTGNPAVDTDFCPTVDGSGVGTNYMGDLQVWPLFPNGDTASAAWAKSSGTVGYSLINETPPDDTGYIDSTTAGDLSEFDLDDLPVNITYIRGLGIHARLSKSDAGAAMVKLGMKSVAATSDAAERPVTVAPAYWRDIINVDPNSTARWTRASLNAAKLRLTRSI